MEVIRREKALNLPNALTLLRIALLPFVVWRYVQGDIRGALVIYLLAMLTDVADGVIARRLNQITALGKLLDPLADKLSLFVLLALFVWNGQVSMLPVQLILVKEIILILGSAGALRVGIVVSADPIGKVTTLLFTASMVCRFLSYRALADTLLWLSVLLSFSALVWYALALIKRLKLKIATA